MNIDPRKINLQRVEKFIEAMAKNPDIIRVTGGFLFIKQPAGALNTFVDIDRVKEYYPKEFETWQAHQALEKLKNSGE